MATQKKGKTHTRPIGQVSSSTNQSRPLKTAPSSQHVQQPTSKTGSCCKLRTERLLSAREPPTCPPRPASNFQLPPADVRLPLCLEERSDETRGLMPLPLNLSPSLWLAQENLPSDRSKITTPSKKTWNFLGRPGALISSHYTPYSSRVLPLRLHILNPYMYITIPLFLY